MPMYVNPSNGHMFGLEYLSVDTVDKYNSATLWAGVRHFATLPCMLPIRNTLLASRWAPGMPVAYASVWYGLCIRTLYASSMVWCVQ